MSTDLFTTLLVAAAAIVAVGAAIALVAYLVLRALLMRGADRIAGRLQAVAPPGAPSRADELARLDRLARLMDEAVRLPVVGGVGLDAALGLVPVAGDVVSLLVGAALVAHALRLGIPRPVVAKMILNVCLDLAVGALPLAGDLADVFVRSNARNMRLLRQALRCI